MGIPIHIKEHAILGVKSQTELDGRYVNIAGDSMTGSLAMNVSADTNSIKLTPTGNAGNSVSTGGAINLINTSNSGAGLVIYSNIGTTNGRLLNIWADNANFNQAAFHVDYDGIANAVEIVHNGSDASAIALNIISNNPADTTLGVVGNELSKGTVKIVHSGTGLDTSASALSIDLKGTGTAARGIFVDASMGGTTGDLMNLRNAGSEKFVVYSGGTLITQGSGVFGATGSSVFTEGVRFLDKQNFSNISTTSSEGDVWKDTTQKSFAVHFDNLKQFVPGIIYVGTGNALIGNSSAELTLIGTGIGSLTLPADFFVVGKTLRVNVSGVMSSDASPSTLTIKVKLGSVAVLTTDALTPAASLSNRYFEVDGRMTCRTTGAAGSVFGQGKFIYSFSTTNGSIWDMENTAPALINTTTTHILDVTAQWTGSDTNRVFSGTNTIVEVLN